LLAGLLSAAGLSYGIVLCLAYLHVTSPNSLWPDVRALDAVFFKRAKPVSTIQRLLESAEGPMNRAGTMRPAFTEQSIGWESLTQSMTTDEKSKLAAERDGERLAVLAWVRSGPSRQAFEADDFRWDEADALHPITPAYLTAEQTSGSERGVRVRIRSLVTDRCVICHGENGRHELARWIPLDTYENIERHCRPEADIVTGSQWIIAALGGLLPLGLISAPLFSRTATPSVARRLLIALPLVAQAVACGAWLFGQPESNAIYVLVGAAFVAAIGVLIQIIASMADLLGYKVRV
jgi:hypothetical protein